MNFIVTWMAVVALSSILARICQKREPVIPEALAVPLQEYLRHHTVPQEDEMLMEGSRDGNHGGHRRAWTRTKHRTAGIIEDR